MQRWIIPVQEGNAEIGIGIMPIQEGLSYPYTRGTTLSIYKRD
jgi:hypothetical protein